MARPVTYEFDKMSPFAKWLVKRMDDVGTNANRVADHVGMHVSQLHKIIKSYRPNYASYQRPGYERTRAIGELLGDVEGALRTAGFEASDQELSVKESGDWRRSLREMEKKLSEMPSARTEMIVALWNEQLGPHYTLYRELEKEEKTLQVIREKRGEYKTETSDIVDK